jgi:hypothetical protein
MSGEVTSEVPNQMKHFSEGITRGWFRQLADAIFGVSKEILKLLVNLRKPREQRVTRGDDRYETADLLDISSDRMTLKRSVRLLVRRNSW